MATSAHTLDELLVARMERIEQKLDALLERAPTDPDEALSRRKVARLLHVNRSQGLKKLIDQGAIHTVTIRGKEKIAREEVQRVLREGTSTPAPTAAGKKKRGGSMKTMKRQTVEEVSRGIAAIPIPRDDD